MKTYDERTQNVKIKLEQLKAARTRRRRLVAGTCICLALILAVVLFVPYDNAPPDVSMYADSPYYGLIQKLNAATYRPPVYANNFEALVGSLRGGIGFASGGTMGVLNSGSAMGPVFDAVAGSPELGDKEEYVEVTDNQVAGVTEADIMKRSDKYIYYLSGDFLSVYSIAGEESLLVGSYNSAQCMYPEGWEQGGFGYTADNVEMYLSQDCTTVTVLMDSYDKELGSYVLAVNLDVSDPANIQTVDYVCFPGSIVSSRMVEGELLLTYNYHLRDVNFSEEDTFVPCYGKPGDMTLIPAEDIVCPEDVNATRYTVVCKLDGKTLEVQGSTALLSYSQQLYVSRDAVFATHSFTEKSDETLSGYTSTAMTEITGISYSGDSLEKLGTVTLQGNVKDQYSMDAYNGILRVVTTTSVSGVREQVYDGYVSAWNTGTEKNVNLYCVDLSDWAVVASVVGFAPEGEEATSVRFDGDYAYVCTAEIIRLTDPVYFFDLSDLSNITYTDTGTISGYSTSLIQLGDGYLLGIGYGDARQLKVEVYEETAEGVVSVCTYEQDAGFSEVYKSYLVDRENDLIGLGIYDYHEGAYRYVLLHFNGYKLNEIARVPLGDGWYLNTVRACIVDGYLYICAANMQNITVEKVW